MAYEKEYLFSEAIKAIEKDISIRFIEDLADALGISKQTLYRHFPVGSPEKKELDSCLIASSMKRRSDKNISRIRAFDSLCDGSGYVYLIRCEGTSFYKIGVSRSSVSSRLANLQCCCPFELLAVHISVSSRYKSLEAELHHKYRKVRERGEWFNFTKEDINDVIKSMDVGNSNHQLALF